MGKKEEQIRSDAFKMNWVNDYMQMKKDTSPVCSS